MNQNRKQNEASRMTLLNGPDQVPLAQPVLAPLTRAAIFLVVTVKPEAESYATVRSFCGDLCRHHSRGGVPRHRRRAHLYRGFRIGCLGPALRQSPASRIASLPRVPGPATAMPPPLRATCCFTSVPNEWTSALSWQPRSWNALGTRFRLPTRCKASATSKIAT